MRADKKQIRAFLQRRFADHIGKTAPSGRAYHLLVWTRKPNRSRFFTETDEATRSIAEECESGRDVYVGMSLLDGAPRRGRGKEADVGLVPGVWADIDVDDGTGAHRVGGGGKKLPPDLDAALSIITDAGLPPSEVIFSGHGIQSHHLFEEPLVVADEAARAKAKEIVRHWDVTIRAHAKRRGYHLDAVGDLARVLRPPGTWNYKVPDTPVNVRVLNRTLGGSSSRRHTRGTILAMCISDSPNPNPNEANESSPGGVHVHPPVRMDTARIEEVEARAEVLCVNDPRFQSTWTRTRRDLGDPSASGYDLAIAAAGVCAELTDQQIVDLMYVWRLRHNEDVAKIGRADYLTRTLAKARGGPKARADRRPPVSITPAAPGTTAPSTADGRVPAPRNLTDLGNARRLVELFGGNALYCYPLRRWYIWDGRRWALDDTGRVERYAKKVPDIIRRKAAEDEK